MQRIPALVGIALLLIAAIPVAAASPPVAREDATKLVLSNDQVTAWFPGKAPSLKIIPSAAAASAVGDNATVAGSYSYRFLQVVEYRDINGDGAPSDNELLATLALDGASGWTAERVQSDGVAAINFTLNGTAMLANGTPTPAPVALPGGVPSVVDREAQVGFVFTLRGQAAAADLGTVNLSMPASAVQQGFVVAKWPWIDAANDRLALVGQVDGALDTSSAAGLERAAVKSNGTALGALAWATTAQATGDAGAKLLVPVKTTIEAAAGNATSRITQTFDAPGVRTLSHASTIGLPGSADALVPGGAGVVQSIKPSPAPGVVLAVGTVGVAAVALRLRKK